MYALKKLKKMEKNVYINVGMHVSQKKTGLKKNTKQIHIFNAYVFQYLP